MSRPALTALRIGDRPDQWRAIGFAVEGDLLSLGGVTLRLDGAGGGIGGWSLSGIAPDAELDGLPTAVEPGRPPPDAVPVPHPNGATGLDHVVVATPDFERTERAFDAAGLTFRRIRDGGGFRQGFRRLGPAIAEVVEAPQAPPGPARFWGLVAVVPDLQALHDRLGPELIGAPKPAVQPGRMIATVRRAAGLSQAVAFLTPEPEVARVDAPDDPEPGAYPPP